MKVSAARLRHRFRALGALVVVVVGAVSLPGCGGAGSATGSATSAGRCVTGFQSGTDYFPDKVSLVDATGFSVEYHDYYKVVTVARPTPGGASQKYVLVQCGAPQPQLTGDLASAPRITVPVSRVAASSTTQLPAFDLLGHIDAVAAVNSPDLVNTPAVVERIKNGRITGFGNSSGGINVERVIAARPDLYLAGGIDGPVVGKISEAKIPVAADSEWLEPTPLGRAEWVKYVALFVNGEKQATAAFDRIAGAYHSVQAKASAVTGRPTVVVGKQDKGTWYVAGGRSYVAALLRDAGGRYVFAADNSTGSVPVDLETVLAKGASADFWLNAEMTPGWKSAAEVTGEDPRYGKLAALGTGNVWSPVKRVNAAGGNDYWEGGVVHPDLVLADLVAILHPELMPGHEFTYYTKLGS